MIHKSIRFAFVIGLLLFAGTAAADFWGGCVDALGRAVPDRANYSVNDIAVSRLDPSGSPVIEYNPNIVLSVSLATRRFFYLHECGHHALGQVVTGQYLPLVSEQEADCWAANESRRQGLSLADLREIQNDVARSPGDWSHLPGPRRALNLEACLQGAVTRQPTCTVVTEYVPQQVMVPKVVPQQIPCRHCGCNGWGCGCLHAFDVVPQTIQVPVIQQVPVNRTVCTP